MIYLAVYNFLIYLIYPVILGVSFFSRKLRENIKIRSVCPRFDHSGKDNIWFHAASVGEYEQIRPLILKIKQEHPRLTIFVSVFSYSAYTQCREDHLAHFFFPLPFDLYHRTQKTVKAVRPKLICYSRYDVWPNMAQIARKQEAYQVLISATLSENSSRNRFPFSLFYSKIYRSMDQIFVVDRRHQERFQRIGLSSSIAGDTRYDSIKQRIKQKNKNDSHIQQIKKTAGQMEGRKILVGGSTYETSETFLIEFIQKSKSPPLLILAPHETNPGRIRKIEHKIKQHSLDYIKYTDWCQQKTKKMRSIKTLSYFSILLVDIPGILLRLYSIADLCYVGGGWRNSVHSTIEPAFFGIPILAGPNIKNSQDAIDLRRIGLIQTMKNTDHNEVKLWYLSNKKKSKEIQKKTLNYIQEKSGASDKIYNKLVI